ncbi:MAG TPA: hypothetical protein VHB97_03495 [Polyangia bacterium]|jgi:hypothetical protein|nr:hypothetical protein [Polyangia bacterium]
MRKLVTIFVVVAASCSYTFDTTEPTLPYDGNPPDTAALPRLNTASVDGEVFALGADKRAWLLLQHTDQSWEMMPMSGAPDSDTLQPDEQMQLVTWRALYILERPQSVGVGDGGVPPDFAVPPDMARPVGDMGAPPPPNVKLIVRSVGEHPGVTFEVPDGPALLYSLGSDDAFVYIVTDPGLPGYLIQRRDGSYRRIIPWPKGIDPANPFKNGLFFGDAGGLVFYDRDVDGRIVGHHTRDNLDVDLGIRPRFLIFADNDRLVTCGPDGVRVVPVDGVTPETVLDDDICKTSMLSIADGYVYYVVATSLRKAKLDGTEAPQTLWDFGQARVLGIATPGDHILYSTDPADRYVHGAGDGWLGGWKFMERGLAPTFSSDFTSLYWLEHAAQSTGAGDLMTVKLPGPGLPGGTPTTLAKNSRQFSFLHDGRILADENRVNNGTWNRVVVIDETRGHKQYVAVGANHPSPIPFSNDYIVDVVTGATGHDVVRVPLPAIDPPPPPNN